MTWPTKEEMTSDELEAEKRRHLEKNRALRREVIQAYGGKCACCGETRLEFLALDHLNRDGAEHRRALGVRGGGHNFYVILKRLKWPVGLQVLCHNCNAARYYYGRCPHELDTGS